MNKTGKEEDGDAQDLEHLNFELVSDHKNKTIIYNGSADGLINESPAAVNKSVYFRLTGLRYNNNTISLAIRAFK